ncbi:hypothetical protein ID866_5827 [Astraeus odoratus]|nr:hypothetical protein ID866_5827 [Astraeus odoratus]
MRGISTDFGSTISIISDWMVWGNVRTFVENKGIDPRPLLIDIVAGLDYLHGHDSGPIFHGDLKGLNVLVSNDCRALLTDFGYSILSKSTLSTSMVSPRGGSVPWMAPELLDECEMSTAGDVWAFGMTALELFTRADPFAECRLLSVLMCKIFRGPPNRPSQEETCFRMTEAWWDICTMCWERDPLIRPSVKQVMEKMRVIQL